MAPSRHSGDTVTVLHASERKSAIQTLIKANSGKVPDTIFLEVDVRPSLSSSRVTADFGQPDRSQPVNVVDACNGAAYTLHYTELDVLKQLRARKRPIKVQSILKDAAGRKYFRLSTNWASDRKTGLFHVTAYGQPRPTGTSVDIDTTSSTKESPRPTKPSQVSSRLTTEMSRRPGHSSKSCLNVEPIPYCRSDSTSMSIQEVGGMQTPAESTVETDSAIWDDRTIGTIQTMETMDPLCERVKAVVPSQFTFPRESVLSRPEAHDTKELFDERYGGGCLPERRGLSRPSPRAREGPPPGRRPASVAAAAPAITQPSTFAMGASSVPRSIMGPSSRDPSTTRGPSVTLTPWTEGSTTDCNRNTVGRRLPVPVSSMPAPHSLSTESRSTVQWIHQGLQTPAPERTAPSNRSVLSTVRPSFATTYAPTSSVTTLTVGPLTPRDVSYATATAPSNYRPTWKRLEPSLPTRSLSTTYTATSQATESTTLMNHMIPAPEMVSSASASLETRHTSVGGPSHLTQMEDARYLYGFDEINAKRAAGCLPNRKRRTLCCGGPSRRMSEDSLFPSSSGSVLYEEYRSSTAGDYTSVTGSLAHKLIPPRRRPGCLELDERSSIDTVAINALHL